MDPDKKRAAPDEGAALVRLDGKHNESRRFTRAFRTTQFENFSQGKAGFSKLRKISGRRLTQVDSGKALFHRLICSFIDPAENTETDADTLYCQVHHFLFGDLCPT
jgi:hypothetical protein